MPSVQTQYRLADLLKAIADGEKQIEITRQVLAEKSAFEPYAAFQRIDRNANGFITSFELLDYLRETDVAATERDILTIFREHDTQREDRISYTEFLNITLPKTSSVLRQLATQRETYSVAIDEVLPYEIEFALARVFEKEIDSNTKIALLKQELADRYDFNPLVLFEVIDQDGFGYINFDSLYLFFKNNDIPILETEVIALLRNVDRNVDGKITYSEFNRAISEGYSSTVRVSSPTRRVASPLRQEASPRRVASPTRRVASPTRRVASPTRRVASPLRQEASPRRTLPIRQEASPLRRTASPTRRVASPIRQEASPTRHFRVSSPLRTTSVASPLRNRSVASPRSNVFAESASKLTNYDYIDYVHNSSRASARSPTRQALSPVRDSLTKKLQESQVEVDFTVSRSTFRTPTKLRETSPLRETSFRSGSPSRSKGISREVLSPMKGNEEDQLVRALKEQIDLDKDLEAIKVDLALRRDFNLLDTFKFFDLEGVGSIGKRDLKSGLNELSIFPTTDELYLVLRKFDRDNDGLLRYADFSELLAPKDGGYAEILNKRQPAYTQGANLGDVFGEQTLFLLKKVLNKVISNEASSESIRQRLNRRPLFNLWEAFKALDRDNNGFISSFEFKNMLIDNGFFPSQKEISSLVDRYDKNQDGKISYSEFIQEITPKSPQKY